MFDTVTLWKYGGVVGALLLAGIGAPIPEEGPIVTAGALVGHDANELAEYNRADDAADEFEAAAPPMDAAGAVAGGTVEHVRPVRPEPPGHLTRWWIMLPAVIVAVVVGDVGMYCVGRFGGEWLLSRGWVRKRVLPPDKRAKIEANFAKYGILILLGARLTPGIRTPVFIMAGVLRMPISRFVLADFLYAIPGVCLLFWLAYWFTDQITVAIHAVEKHKPIAIAVVVGVVGAFALYKFLSGRRKLSTGDPGDIPTYVKPVGAVTHAVEQTIEKTVAVTVHVGARAAAAVADKVAHPLGRGKPAGEQPPADPPHAPGPPVVPVTGDGTPAASEPVRDAAP